MENFNSNQSLSSSSTSSLRSSQSLSSSLLSSPPKDGSLLSRIEEKISHVYYKHGLICSRRPIIVIMITLVIVCVSCYPILGIHYLLGRSSQQFVTSFNDFNTYIVNGDSSTVNSESEEPIPRWFESNMPYAYVQQIVIKSAVIPWRNDMILMDAIRAPLSVVFSLFESINNYQIDLGNSKFSLNDVCFQVSEPIPKMDRTFASYLPSYSCLMVSPANVWQNDINNFLRDSTIIKTLYSIKDLASPDSSGSLREALFGVPWMETGIKRLYVRTRQRTITYTITIIYSKYNEQYLEGLSNYLRDKFPANPNIDGSDNGNSTDNLKNTLRVTNDDKTVTHLYFQNHFTLSDFIPLGATYVMLFLYVYFSVRKIDLVKCKWALALCSVLTVIMSLLMSLGICLRFGFNPTLNGSYILPYLVVVIGLENMLVMTNSVVSIPAHLDIKVRVAQGLSREGWSITKNLMTEITILTFGFFTFVPVIQEFCLFATVGLLSDFFLQLSFFVTVLSVDIQRLELKGHEKNVNNSKVTANHSRQNSADANSMFGLRSYPTSVYARPAKPIPFKMPKRLRLVYFVARTRLVQRVLMLVLIGWISLLVYKSGIMEHFSNDLRDYDEERDLTTINDIPKQTEIPIFQKPDETNNNNYNYTDTIDDNYKSMSLLRLKHTNLKLWKLLSSQHWSALFGYYNLTLLGKYISILPSIQLSIPIDPESAFSTRHPSESDPQIFRQFLSPGGIHTSIDPNDETDDLLHGPNGEIFRSPWSTGEIFVTMALSIPSIIFIVYLFVVMYRCMCTRNYAEWRYEWSQKLQSIRGGNGTKKDITSDLIYDINPFRLHEHYQEIEHICSNHDTPFVVSTCMQGDVRVWDVLSGECLTLIRRSSTFSNSFSNMKNLFQSQHKQSGSFSSDSTYSSSPGNASNEFDLGNVTPESINNPKQLIAQQISQSSDNCGYNFSPYFNRHFSSQNVLANLILNAKVNNDDQICTTGDVSVINTMIDSILQYEPIWCCEIFGKLIIIGSANGRIEVWDALNGELCFNYDENLSGVTILKATSTKLIVARLNGILEIFHLEISNGFSVSISSQTPRPAHRQMIRYNLQHSVRAHLQPITALEIEGSHIVTGSLDHLLKVFRSDTANCVYTFNGHCGGITAIHIDNSSSCSAISGCQVGQVCVWDILTGTCVFSLEAHQDSSVSSLLATPLYFISAGTDNRICIWDKYSGHLVHTINQHHNVCKNMILLTSNILITVREDHLVLWDINEASPIRIIMLNVTGEKRTFIKGLKLSSQSKSVVCDYGKQLCVIQFPGTTEKND